MAVTNCNIDMESLISDQNRSIATLAITTLLKTGNEPGVDRLMKQITNFMSNIADEMNFLSNILMEEGGFKYKKVIVDSIVILIRDIPDALESGLLHLCEVIEDCEFTYLSTQTSDPSKYIRYIYDRVILENATVQASAVSTLAKFGAMVDSLKEPTDEPFDISSVPREVKSQPLAEVIVVDALQAEEFAELTTKPLKSLPYDTFVAFEKPEGVPAVGIFSNVLKFLVKEVDPSTGEAEEDGVEDEYQLEDYEIVAVDYMLKVGVSNFKNAWESLGSDFEQVDEYGLGLRENLSEAVINLLGMQPCEDFFQGFRQLPGRFPYPWL
ncbi:hypothetical protein CTI12_AA072610 [Artemisia annua]|uniref:Coatomer subunit gamma n=1 Tax=Artemisia annua TaxID=35608 RepID=A0A2U1PW49_ARTAN|nr:hypothetical protein CTI12_AA072610 [Artemisia annua]